jgi:histidinol dehydrogenase
MLGVPAKLAGVPRIIVCTPPGTGGRVDGAILYTAKLLGIEETYRVGGAQAVAAVAYGTETIPACAKIVGPGSVYTTAAKRLLADTIDPGPAAGPSESIILCDDSPNPENVALNLLIEAEHGKDSCALLVTHDEELVRRVAEVVEQELPKMTPQRAECARHVLRTYGGAVITRSLDESIAFVDEFAVEHLAIMARDSKAICERIHNAGEILIGDYPILGLTDYVIGVNAILPTSRYARTESPVSVRGFMKSCAIVEVAQGAYDRIVEPVVAFSEHEGFSAHHRAVQHWKR